MGIVDSVDAQKDTRQDTCCILSAIHKMRKDVPGVFVTADTLQESPIPWSQYRAR